MRKYNFIHSFGLGKMYPTKLISSAIQIDFSSQLLAVKKSMEKHRIIIKTISVTCTKKTISERGTDVCEQHFQGALSWLFSSNTKFWIPSVLSSDILTRVAEIFN